MWMTPSAMHKACLGADRGSVIQGLRNAYPVGYLHQEPSDETIPCSHGIHRRDELNRLCIVVFSIIEERTLASSCNTYDGSPHLMGMAEKCSCLLI